VNRELNVKTRNPTFLTVIQRSQPQPISRKRSAARWPIQRQIASIHYPAASSRPDRITYYRPNPYPSLNPTTSYGVLLKSDVLSVPPAKPPKSPPTKARGRCHSCHSAVVRTWSLKSPVLKCCFRIREFQSLPCAAEWLDSPSPSNYRVFCSFPRLTDETIHSHNVSTSDQTSEVVLTLVAEDSKNY
jgi:hypothetical protein